MGGEDTVAAENHGALLAVMAGLDPAIHVFASVSQGVDARHEAGHDGL